MHDLQKLALKNDSRQQALKLEKKILLQQKKARLRRYLPSVNLSVQRDRVVANSNSDQTSNHWQIQINQPIYDGGRNQIDRKINLMQIQNLNDRAKILQSQIQLEGLSIYLETMTEYQRLLSERGEKKRMEQQERQARSQQQAGWMNPLTLSRIQIQNQLQRIKVDQVALEANRVLNQLIAYALPQGKKQAANHTSLFTWSNLQDLSQIQIQLTIPEEKNIVWQKIYDQSPDALAIKEQFGLAFLNKKRQERENLPRVFLLANYGRSGDRWPPNRRNYALGFQVELPLGSSTFRQQSLYHQSRIASLNNQSDYNASLSVGDNLAHNSI